MGIYGKTDETGDIESLNSESSMRPIEVVIPPPSEEINPMPEGTAVASPEIVPCVHS